MSTSRHDQPQSGIEITDSEDRFQRVLGPERWADAAVLVDTQPWEGPE
jgi:hypothetical protein